MDISSTLKPDPQTAETFQPRQSALHDPAMFAQVRMGIHSPAAKARGNASFLQCQAMAVTVVTPVCMQFDGSVSQHSIWPRQCRDGIHHFQQHGNVTYIGGGMPYCERDSLGVDHKMALRARFSAIRRIWAGFFAPPGAGTLPASMLARDQSIWSDRDNRSNNTRCSCSHTPASCQSRNRRQQVMPLPQPSSGGSISQGIPVLNTNRIPVKTARLLRRGRPPLGLGGSGGRRGSMICHNSSLISTFAIPLSYQDSGFC